MRLKLNTNNTKLMTTGTTTSLGTDNEDSEVRDCFCLLEATIDSKGPSNQKICHGPVLVKAAMKALEQIFRYCDVSTFAKSRIVGNCYTPGWILTKQDRKSLND